MHAGTGLMDKVRVCVCACVCVRVRECASVFKSVWVHAYIHTGTGILGIDFLAGFVGEKGVEWGAACACCVLYMYCIWSSGGLRSCPVGMKSFLIIIIWKLVCRHYACVYIV